MMPWNNESRLGCHALIFHQVLQRDFQLVLGLHAAGDGHVLGGAGVSAIE